MAQKYAFLVDPSKCTFCRACVVACKLENRVGSQWTRNDVVVVGPDQEKDPPVYAVFMNCMQCENPPCIAACPVEGKGLEKRADGIVLVKPNSCAGNQFCVQACPYGALRLTPTRNAHGYEIVDKCTYCAHKLDRPADAPGGNRPACAQACPTNAIEFGLRDELLAKVTREGRATFDIDFNDVGPGNIILKPRATREAWAKL